MPAPATHPASLSTPTSFKRLPAELLLLIIDCLTDLPSLRNLVQASRACHEVFIHNNGAAIIQRIMQTSTIPKQVQSTIWLVALIRSLTPFCQEYATLDALLLDKRQKRDFSAKAGEMLPPHALLELLESIYKLQCLTQSCLQHFISQSLSVRPIRVRDPKFRYEVDKYGAPWRVRPEGQQVVPKNVGPPSWPEESRMSCAFWHIQLLYDLQIAAAENRLGWSRADVERLHTMEAWEFAAFHPDVERERILCLLEYVEEIKEQTRAKMEKAAATTAAESGSAWEFSMFPMSSTFDHHERRRENSTSTIGRAMETATPFDRRRLPGLNANPIMPQHPCYLPWPVREVPVTQLLQPHREPEFDRHRYCILTHPMHEIKCLSDETAAHYLVKHAFNNLYASPLRCISSEPFRRWGLVFWDKDRLMKLKLLDYKDLAINNAVCQPGDILFRWRSILTEAELEAHDQIAEERLSCLLAQQNNAL